MRATLTLPICLAFWAISLPGVLLAQQSLAIKAGKIITVSGDAITDGVIVVRDGMIAAVGTDVEIPVDAKIIDASSHVVMPGFVEAHSSDGMGQANETNPIVPYVSVMDEINPMDAYFQEARRNGVTCVAITPGNTTMIGGQAAILKTGGEFVDSMVLKEDAGVKISLRPVRGSRMSHLAKLRETLDAARKKMEKKESKEAQPEAASEEKAEPAEGEGRGRRGRRREPEGGADTDAAADLQEGGNEGSGGAPSNDGEKTIESELDRALFALLEGKLPAIIYCDQAMDVGTAVRLVEEYGLDARLVVGKDCYKAVEALADLKVPVVLDSDLVFWERDPRTEKETKVILPKVFRDHQVPVLFQVGRNGTPTLGQNYLWYQAATAVKYGMPEKEALEALTLLPAKFHKIDSFVGSIEVGKDADLVILSGDPLKVDTWVEKTIVNGQVVYEKETDDQLKRLLSGEESK